MFQAAALAFNQIFSKPFRGVFWKALGLTILLFLLLGAGIQTLITEFLLVPYPWLETAIAVATGVGLIFGMAFLIAPVTSIFAGIFLDEIADIVERKHYPHEEPGKEMPLIKSIGLSIRFFLVVLAVNAVAFILVLFFGLGIFIFFIANGYLLGREYFQLAAFRFRSPEETKAFQKKHSGTVFVAGLVIAGFLAIPLLNLLTPLFATAFMVHIHKQLSGSTRSVEIIEP